MKALLDQISTCRVCEPFLDLGCRPVVSASPKSKLVIIGQAPGLAVHRSGVPWDDKSGDNLRRWMGVEPQVFYDPEKVALIPVGFCYPGKGKTGDLPPRKECAPLWHHDLMAAIQSPSLIVLVGKYAQDYYLKGQQERNLTETIRQYKTYLPQYFVLPHPSPRNNIWKAKHPWFEREVLPEFKAIVSSLLG